MSATAGRDFAPRLQDRGSFGNWNFGEHSRPRAPRLIKAWPSAARTFWTIPSHRRALKPDNAAHCSSRRQARPILGDLSGDFLLAARSGLAVSILAPPPGKRSAPEVAEPGGTPISVKIAKIATLLSRIFMRDHRTGPTSRLAWSFLCSRLRSYIALRQLKAATPAFCVTLQPGPTTLSTSHRLVSDRGPIVIVLDAVTAVIAEGTSATDGALGNWPYLHVDTASVTIEIVSP